MTATLALPPWLGAIAGAAIQGVPLFFVVSAFTLTIRAGRDHGGIRGYALRRIARVGPGYWIAGLAYTLATGLVRASARLWAPHGVAPIDLIIAALFGSAWQGGASFAVVPGGWSVSCEVAFYVALPFLIRVIDGHIWRSIVLTGVAMVIAQLRARHAMLSAEYTYPFYANPIEQAPVFLCGVTAALVAMQVKLPHVPGAAVALLALAVTALPFLPISRWYLLPHLPFAGLVSVAVALSATHPPSLLGSRVLRRIGEVSYSIYLIHFALLASSLRLAEWLIPASDWRTMLMHFIFIMTASFSVACVTYRTIEQPAIRWASRLTLLRPAAVVAID